MMRLVTDDTENDTLTLPVIDEAEKVSDEDFPGEAEMILSAMDAAAVRPAVDRRTGSRRGSRGVADLRLYAHGDDAPPMKLYTRDISSTTVGFITQDRLPLGYNGLVRITLNDGGDVITASCQVYRCRPAVGGWYEGALHFTRRRVVDNA